LPNLFDEGEEKPKLLRLCRTWKTTVSVPCDAYGRGGKEGEGKGGAARDFKQTPSFKSPGEEEEMGKIVVGHPPLRRKGGERENSEQLFFVEDSRGGKKRGKANPLFEKGGEKEKC